MSYSAEWCNSIFPTLFMPLRYLSVASIIGFVKPWEWGSSG